ncbi:hypothetical protein NMG60_11017968 [Bertholletia excelsa]
MDTAQWPQMEGSRPISDHQRRPRPQKEQALNCPRCNSTNTKFCYYNNYSLSQPRYFCKTCRRYWTEGGSLRNVPVGGGSRKNKRSSTSSSPSSTTPSKRIINPDLIINTPDFPQNRKTTSHEAQDLNLAYPPSTLDYTTNNPNPNPNPNLNLNSSHISSMDILKAPRGLGSSMAMPTAEGSTIYPSGFSLEELKPSLGFALNGFESGYGGLQGVQESSARMFFPFEELKQAPASTDAFVQNRGQGEPTGYWTGLLGGGSW